MFVIIAQAPRKNGPNNVHPKNVPKGIVLRTYRPGKKWVSGLRPEIGKK